MNLSSRTPSTPTSAPGVQAVCSPWPGWSGCVLQRMLPGDRHLSKVYNRRWKKSERNQVRYLRIAGHRAEFDRCLQHFRIYGHTVLRPDPVAELLHNSLSAEKHCLLGAFCTIILSSTRGRAGRYLPAMNPCIATFVHFLHSLGGNYNPPGIVPFTAITRQ